MTITDAGTTRRLWRHVVGEDRGGFLLGLGLGAAGGFIELVGAAGIYPFLALLSRPDFAREHPILLALRTRFGLVEDKSFLLAFGALCLAAFLVSTAFLIARQAYMTRYAMGLTARVSTRLLANYLRRPYAFFLDRHSAELAKNVVAQADATASGTLLPWMALFSESFIIAALAGLVLWMDPAAGAIVILGLGGLTGLILLSLRGRVQRLGREADQANGRRFAYCLEALQSVKEIKAADAEDAFWRKFELPAAAFSSAFAEANVAQVLPSPLIQSAAVCAMLGLAMYLAAKGRPPAEIVPLLSVYAAAGYRLMPSLSRASVAFAQMRQFHSQFVEATDVLASAAAPPAPSPRPARALQFRSRLEFQNVGFAYPGPRGARRALDGVSLTIPHGAFAALAGGSGAGKTTLADILLGLLGPQEGRLLVDGRTLNPEDLPAWRRRIGYIPQSVFISDDTVAANVAFGVAESAIDEGRAREALRLARLDEFVASLPNGLLTRVGERGALLSGGQRQRLGIARALYRDPDLLVMDESTSALDGITEGELLDSLAALRGSKTLLVIAHRPTTIRRADKIMLLKAGRLAAEGSYDDLSRRDPHFAALMSQPAA
ncbi:MAG: ABC transporter ATP-binding protein [Elusimicrobia bacterium]|nr:ABC transporter ATP-binding protein [Elusimicrobiota bacterium]